MKNNLRTNIIECNGSEGGEHRLEVRSGCVTFFPALNNANLPPTFPDNSHFAQDINYIALRQADLRIVSSCVIEAGNNNNNLLIALIY
jgi:hypothetical protein